MSWHIDSDDNAYNELGTVIAPVERTINGQAKFEIYLWFPQIDLYDDIAVVDTLSEAKAFIKGYVTGYNDKLSEDEDFSATHEPHISIELEELK